MAVAAPAALSPRCTRYWQEGETALMTCTLLEQDVGSRIMGRANVEDQANLAEVSSILENAGYRHTPVQSHRKL